MPLAEFQIEYPKGALKSIEEFQSLWKGKPFKIYAASRKHSYGFAEEILTTGNISIKKYADRNIPDYIGFECRYRTVSRAIDRSCLDMHLLHQNYNDWFLFADKADAELYLA